MNHNYVTTISLFFSFLCSLSMAQDIKVDVDPVKSFKEYLTIHFESYKTDRRERLTKLSGGWVREYFEPDDNYKIDVQKTNSLITPLIGFCTAVQNKKRVHILV